MSITERGSMDTKMLGRCGHYVVSQMVKDTGSCTIGLIETQSQTRDSIRSFFGLGVW